MFVPYPAANLLLGVHLRDEVDDPITGQAHDAVGLSVAYRLETSGTYVEVSLVAGTPGTYVANSWVEIGDGEYQLCLPNAAFAAGKETKLRVIFGSNDPLFDTVRVGAAPLTVTCPVTPATITDGSLVDAALAEAIAGPRSASVDGVSTTSHSLPDLIAAAKFLAAQKAAAQPHRGIRFSKIVRGGSA